MLVPLSAIVKITITYTASMSLERKATTLTLFPELSVLFYPGLAPFLLGFPIRRPAIGRTESQLQLFKQPVRPRISTKA